MRTAVSRRERPLRLRGGDHRQLHGGRHAARLRADASHRQPGGNREDHHRADRACGSAALTDSVTVTGETPLVDLTNVTGNIRVRREEFERLPVGRSYQALVIATPGVVGGAQQTGSSNVNALGSPQGGNLYVMDSIDTTDPTTGTFGANLNFEAIQEVSVSTSAVSVELRPGPGRDRQRDHQVRDQSLRGLGQVHRHQRRLGQAELDGRDETTGQSLERVKFDQGEPGLHLHPRRPDLARPRLVLRRLRVLDQHHAAAPDPGTDPRGLPAGHGEQLPERPRHRCRSPTGHQVWVKYFRSPTDGFIIDYWRATTPAGGTRGADRAEPVERFVGGAVDRRLPRQPGGRGGVRHLFVDSST